MRFRLLLGTLILTIVSCSRNFPVPSPKIPEDRFIEYYTSSLVILQEEKLSGHDSSRIKHRIDSLQQRHHLNPGDIKETIGFYHADLNHWKEMNLKVIKRLEEIQRKNE